MDLEKVLSRLRKSPEYLESARRARSTLDESEERDSQALRKVADNIKKEKS